MCTRRRHAACVWRLIEFGCVCVVCCARQGRAKYVLMANYIYTRCCKLYSTYVYYRIKHIYTFVYMWVYFFVVAHFFSWLYIVTYSKALCRHSLSLSGLWLCPSTDCLSISILYSPIYAFVLYVEIHADNDITLCLWVDSSGSKAEKKFSLERNKENSFTNLRWNMKRISLCTIISLSPSLEKVFYLVYINILFL